MSATRLLLGRESRPIPIGIWVETDVRLAAMVGPLARSRQIAAVGKAVLGVVREERRFRRSLLDGRFIETEGATVMVTGRDKADVNTVLATWDFGEEAMVTIARLGEARKLCSIDPRVAVEYWSFALNPKLPPPAVLISNVMDLDYPDMALGGCGQGCPIALAFGRDKTHVVFDHRIFDSQDEVLFAKLYEEKLNEALGA